MTQLETMSKTARKLANELFSSEECKCTQTTRCMESEEERPLSKAEKMQGACRRVFSAYDPSRMCAGCRSYWYAEMAAQTLHEQRCWQIRAEAAIARSKVAAS